MLRILEKKTQTLTLALVAMLLLTSLMVLTTNRAEPLENGWALSRNPKSKIFGIPASALISELGEDAPILVTLYGTNAGSKKPRFMLN